MSNKSDQAFRTISEVADILDLPQHVLRFWETKFRQVSPLKRGGGRRYYRPQDVELLNRIKSLLHTEGYTIKGVQRMLGQGGLKNLPPVAEMVVEIHVEPEVEVPTSPKIPPGLNLNGLNLSTIVHELEDISQLLKQAVEDQK